MNQIQKSSLHKQVIRITKVDRKSVKSVVFVKKMRFDFRLISKTARRIKKETNDLFSTESAGQILQLKLYSLSRPG